MPVAKYLKQFQDKPLPPRWTFPEDSWAAKRAETKKKRDRLEMMLEMKRLKEL